jgi:hypothetical protein
MSLKDLFNKTEVVNNIVNNFNEIYNNNEINLSNSIIKHKIIPNINFKEPSNFAVFGYAEEYYKNSFKYIVESFPYDGTKQQETSWLNNATYLDRYIYNNVHPRYIGCLSFNNSNEYTYTGQSRGLFHQSQQQNIIKIFGGLNKNLTFDEETNDSNINLDLSDGLTVCFWYKTEQKPDEEGGMIIIGGDTPPPVRNKIIFHFSSDSVLNSTLDSELNIYSYERYNVIGFEFYISNTYIGFLEIPNTDKMWNHYACTLKYNTEQEQFIFKIYKNGLRIKTRYDSYTGNMNLTQDFSTFVTGTIGSYTITDNASVGTIAGYGFGQCFGAKIDEFKLYARCINEEEMYSNFNCREYSTSLDADNKNRLQLYFKFNEGNTGITVYDRIVLDYSGRKSNCIINSYSNNRVYESAFIESGFVEFLEPCINYNNPEVSSLITEYTNIGRAYDSSNSNTFFNNFPNWIKEEDYEASNNLFILCQIIASQLDEIYLQIKNINKIFDADYNSTGIESEELVTELLNSYGIEVKDILNNISFDEWNLIKNDEFTYSATLQKVKSILYRNLYNNLVDINKSKGTKESIRMLFRTLGINEDLYSINMYTDNDINYLDETNEFLSLEKKFINFNDHINGTIHNTLTNFITGSNISSVTSNNMEEFGICSSFETMFRFPKSYGEYDRGYKYYQQSFLTSSMFGIKSLSQAGINFNTGTLDISLNVCRKDRYSELGTFQLHCSSSLGQFTISSDETNIFNGNKWVSALTFTPENPLLINSTDYNINSNYIATAYFYNVENTDSYYILSSSISLKSYSENKAYYLGAKRKNINDDILTGSIGQSFYFRGWLNELSQKDIKSHMKNASNFGTSTPSQNITISTFYSSSYVPKFDSLLFNWDFELVERTDEYGDCIIHDRGKPYSFTNTRTYPSYFMDCIRLNSGTCVGFPTEDDSIVGNDFLSIRKTSKIDNIISQDINIIDDNDLYFSRIKRPISKILTVEKNITDSLNNEMIKYFSDMQNLVNCFGLPYEKYRKSYKNLDSLKTLFFEKINNNLLDYNKYENFYKWIDFSIFHLIQQIIPFGSDSGLYGNFIESHILERNKIQFPVLFQKTERKELVFELTLPNFSEINWTPLIVAQELLSYDWNPIRVPTRIIE